LPIDNSGGKKNFSKSKPFSTSSYTVLT
jgi:hypothetical protein